MQQTSIFYLFQYAFVQRYSTQALNAFLLHPISHVTLILFKHEKDLSTDEEDIAIVAFSDISLKTSEKHGCKLKSESL